MYIHETITALYVSARSDRANALFRKIASTYSIRSHLCAIYKDRKLLEEREKDVKKEAYIEIYKLQT